jgi:serine/threonine-protein kinase
MAGSGGAAPRLFVHTLTDDRSHEVPGSERGYSPFFSADSAQVGFISSGRLWRVPVGGGTPFDVGAIDQGDRGVAWSGDGYIYSGGGGGISRIADAGGTRESLTTVNRAAGEVAHRFPALVPGGRGILFTIFKGGLDEARLAVLDLTTKKWRVLMDRPGHTAQYTSTRHLVYLRTGVLMAVPFDPDRLDVTGSPVPVMNGVLYNNGGAGHFSISAAGMLVYVPDAGTRALTSMVWADRSGRITPIEAPQDAYRNPALSPDGRRLALERQDQGMRSTVVVWDFDRRASTPVTRDTALNELPIWMPDGDTLIMTSRPQAGSVGRLFRQRADGAGSPTQVSTAAIEQTMGSSAEYPGSVSSDGAKVFYAQDATSSDGIKVLDLATAKVETLIKARTFDPRISPDGRWLAYVSQETGLGEVYVRPYPVVSATQWPISNGGGRAPRWSRDGRELFFLGLTANRSAVFGASVNGGAFGTVHPQRLFEAPSAVAAFDVAPDGRFLLLTAIEPSPPIPHVIVNWFETLKRAVRR